MGKMLWMADVPSVQPWGTFLFWRSLDGPPYGWADVWTSPVPSSLQSIPYSQRLMGSPAVAGDFFPQDGGGTGPAAMVLVFGQLQTVPILSLQGLCPTLAVT